MRVLAHDLGDRRLVGIGNMEHARLAAALYQRDHGAFVAGATALEVRAPARCFGARNSDVAVIGFVGFHDLAFAAERAEARRQA